MASRCADLGLYNPDPVNEAVPITITSKFGSTTIFKPPGNSIPKYFLSILIA